MILKENKLIIDVNEPTEILPWLAQVVTVDKQPLNVQGFADYKWTKYNGRERQVERKTWGELLSNVEHVEEQLQRHLTKNPDIELVFMLEGMVVQNQAGSTVLSATNNNRVYVLGRRYTARLNGIYAWLFEISNYLTVLQTSSLYESSIALAAMFNHDQKEQHSTFRRTIKQIAYTPDPRTVTLMGGSLGLGDKRAQSLIDYAGTPWAIWSAGYCEHMQYKDKYEFTKIDGIGKGILDNVYKTIGRPDL